MVIKTKLMVNINGKKKKKLIKKVKCCFLSKTLIETKKSRI